MVQHFTTAGSGAPPRHGRYGLSALLAGLCLAAAPAQALETLRIRMPLLDTAFTLKVSELASPQRLWAGSSDLAELDRATNGQIGRRLQTLLQAPLPLTVRSLVERSRGTPLFTQVMLLVSSLVQIEGMAPDRDGSQLAAALDRLPAGMPLTLLSLLQVLPGQSASIDLERAVLAVQRLLNQQREGEALVERLPAVSQDPALSRLGALPPQSRLLSLAVSHRPEPLQLQLVAPSQGGNGRLVLISHGLWDGPENFLDWADLLASRGYSVVLPFHPGSDKQQQQAMLSGLAPPPSSQELRQRPLDISAVLDAVAAGRLSALAGVNSDRVVVIGHSWGATTALQLAGTTPSSNRLRQRCSDLADPERNLSWVLQCSFLNDADRAALADRRVIAVAAVSPPLNLLFDVGSAAPMQARALLVSGSDDWVVPSGPEAIDRFAAPYRAGHQLVLVKGGDHFNLRGPREQTRAPLSPLLLAWTEAAFAAGASVAPSLGAPPLLAPVGWGDSTLPMVEASAATTGQSAP
ncbi:MAG: alpha/beta hydrolase family protein [Cyanobium sp.]